MVVPSAVIENPVINSALDQFTDQWQITPLAPADHPQFRFGYA